MVREFAWAAALSCCVLNSPFAATIIQTNPSAALSNGPDIGFGSFVNAPNITPGTLNSVSLELSVLWSGLLYYPTFNLAAPTSETVTTTTTISVAGQSIMKTQTNSAVFTPFPSGGTSVTFNIPIDVTILPTNLAVFTSNLVTDLSASAHVALAGYQPGTQNNAEEPPMTSISGRLTATFDVSPVPEPGTLALLGLGLTATALRRRSEQPGLQDDAEH